MDENSLTILAEEIMSQGIKRKTAFYYAALIGDTPMMTDGKIAVFDEQDREIARLEPLKYFDMK